jgi:hypothetical protein
MIDQITSRILEQSGIVILCLGLLFVVQKGVQAIYRDWMGKDSFAKDFFIQHKRMADASVEQVTIGRGLVTEVTAMKDQMHTLEEKVGDVQEGLDRLTHEVRVHAPYREEPRKL